MKLNKRGIDFIKEREGYREAAYQDVAGIWTIGYGTTWVNGRKVTKDDMCDRQLAEIWLKHDIESTEDFVSDIVKIKLGPNEFSALVSLAYNIGFTAFAHSTLLRTINRGDTVYGDLFFRWSKITIKGKKVTSNGLLNRRHLEYELFIRDE